MNLRILRSRLVKQDVAEAADYIARSDYAAALRFLNAAEKTLAILAEMPGLGSPWESDHERLKGVRVVVFEDLGII